MAWLPIAAAAASAVSSVVGGISQARTASYQAQIARNNATIAAQNADYALNAGQAEASKEGLKNAQRQGAIKAAIAANGIDVNSGSALDVQSSELEVSQLDTETILNNAALKAYGYRSQQTGFQAEEQLDKSKEGSAILGGVLGGAGSLLSGASGTALAKMFSGDTSDGGSGAP